MGTQSMWRSEGPTHTQVLGSNLHGRGRLERAIEREKKTSLALNHGGLVKFLFCGIFIVERIAMKQGMHCCREMMSWRDPNWTHRDLRNDPRQVTKLSLTNGTIRISFLSPNGYNWKRGVRTFRKTAELRKLEVQLDK